MKVRVGHVCCEWGIRLLGAQMINDASCARSTVWREHILHRFVTLELSRDNSCPDSVFSVVQTPACRHSLLPKSNVQVHSLVRSKLCESVDFCQRGLHRLFGHRVNKRVQQFSGVFVIVEVICWVRTLSSRYRDFWPTSHSEGPSASLHLADALPVEARPVWVRLLACCTRPGLSFRRH